MQTPTLIYGTAWKEELTEDCVYSALKSGFKAIDTANQRKHYFEEGVGRGLQKAYSHLGIQREELFLQTKFTYARGQDHRLPYDKNASLTVQVRQSFESSLEHLHTDVLDSFLLHGPSRNDGLVGDDWEVWSAMEDLAQRKKVRYIGVSNVSYEQLVELYERSKIKPVFVQNRCFAETKWDQNIRRFCKEHKIFYQGFSLLTANWKFLGGEVQRPPERNIPHLIFEEKTKENNLHKELQAILMTTGKTIQQVIFRFCQQVGMIPITGTRSESHMKVDLNLEDFNLSNSQLNSLEEVAFLR